MKSAIVGGVAVVVAVVAVVVVVGRVEEGEEGRAVEGVDIALGVFLVVAAANAVVDAVDAVTVVCVLLLLILLPVATLRVGAGEARSNVLVVFFCCCTCCCCAGCCCGGGCTCGCSCCSSLGGVSSSARSWVMWSIVDCFAVKYWFAFSNTSHTSPSNLKEKSDLIIHACGLVCMCAGTVAGVSVAGAKKVCAGCKCLN